MKDNKVGKEGHTVVVIRLVVKMTAMSDAFVVYSRGRVFVMLLVVCDGV